MTLQYYTFSLIHPLAYYQELSINENTFTSSKDQVSLYNNAPTHTALLWQKEDSDKTIAFLVKEQNVSVISIDVNGIS